MYQLEKIKKIKNLVHGISTKTDGNMSFNWGLKEEVIKNRKKFLKTLRVNPKKCIVMQLEHKNRILDVVQRFAGRGILQTDAPVADCLITKEKNLFLFLLTADCLPIIFFDPSKKTLALAHLGWKNTDTKFCQNIIKKLKKLGSDPKNIIVGIGPGIHKESYIKGRDIPKWKKFVRKVDEKKFQINLIGYNKQQLLDSGVPETNIEISPINTVKSKNFFSHYYAKKTGKKEARFATIVGML
ncbi:MAG: polyphenol oxidase family protein [bacterium]